MFNLNNLIVSLKEKFSKENSSRDKFLTMAVVIGLIGMAIVLFVDFSGTEPAENNSLKDINLSLETDEYRLSIENELTEVLSKISGVGLVDVMVTIEGTTEYIYAEEITSNESSGEGREESSFKNEYVIIENGNQKEALIKKIIKPKINGVVIVCEGGDNASIAEKVYKSVSTVLDISSARVYVVKGEN